MVATAQADEGKFTLLAENEPAAFEGVLFDPIATAKLLAEYSHFQSKCDLEIEYHLDKQGTEFALEMDNATIRYNSLEEECRLLGEQKDLQIEKLRDTIKKQAPRNKWWWYAGGIASGMIVTYGAYKAFQDE